MKMVLCSSCDGVPLKPNEKMGRAHSFGHILHKKHALSRAFRWEKHEVARAGGIVKFWSF